MSGWNAAGKLLDPSLLGSSGSTTITRLHASFASQVDNAAPTSNTPAMLIGDWLGWGGRDTPATGARARRRTVYGVTAPTKMDLQQWVGLLRSAARSSSPQPILPRSPSGKEVLGEAAAAQWRRRRSLRGVARARPWPYRSAVHTAVGWWCCLPRDLQPPRRAHVSRVRRHVREHRRRGARCRAPRADGGDAGHHVRAQLALARWPCAGRACRGARRDPHHTKPCHAAVVPLGELTHR